MAQSDRPAGTPVGQTESGAARSADTGNPVRTIVTGSAGSSRAAPSAPSDGKLTAPTANSVLGVYRLVELLGEGGMGSVWKAVHTKLKKTVALKVLPQQLTRDPETVARFEREMEAVGALDHTNIVRAMDAGEVGGTHYLVMEYVEGLDLGMLVQSKGRRPVKEACEMIRQAAVGLAHAHQHGLVHRDIKPSNLLLSKQGKVKILDLGLARLQGDAASPQASKQLTGFGLILGTPDYMSPEQWDDTHAVDHRADLYALGCTLFFLLTGRAPYEDAAHQTLAKKLAGHSAEPPPNLKKERPEVSPELDAIYRRLMEKNPAARFATAADVARALALIVTGQMPVTAAVPAAEAIPNASPPLAGIAVAPPAVNGPVAGAADIGIESALAVLAADARPTARPDWREPDSKTVAEGSGRPTKILRLRVAAAVGVVAVVLLAGIIVKIATRDGIVTQFAIPQVNRVAIPTEPVHEPVPQERVSEGPRNEIAREPVEKTLLTDASVLPVPPEVLPQVDARVLPAPHGLRSYRDRIGQTFRFDVVGSLDEEVWGTGTYTDDSSIAAAAVHSGVLKAGERGIVTVTILPGQRSYEASIRNGVISGNWTSFPGSFRISGAEAFPLGENNIAETVHDVGNLLQLRDRVNRTILIRTVGRTNGFCYGTDLYSDDSDVGTAAVHAGLLQPGEAGIVRVKILPAQDSFAGTTRNEVTTSSFGPWEGSFRFEAPEAAAVAEIPIFAANVGQQALQVVTPYADSLQLRPGRVVYVRITGSKDGTVFGTGVYSSDSALPTAAVHAGVLRAGAEGVVKVTTLPGQHTYRGSTRNGVKSLGWTNWPASYRIEKAIGEFLEPLTSYRGQSGKTFLVDVVGSTDGSCYGTDIYSDDTDVATAAVHAGLLRNGERGLLKMTILDGQPRYTDSTRHGVTSLSYGQWSGSFRLDASPAGSEGIAPRRK